MSTPTTTRPFLRLPVSAPLVEVNPPPPDDPGMRELIETVARETKRELLDAIIEQDVPHPVVDYLRTRPRAVQSAVQTRAAELRRASVAGPAHASTASSGSSRLHLQVSETVSAVDLIDSPPKLGHMHNLGHKDSAKEQAAAAAAAAAAKAEQDATQDLQAGMAYKSMRLWIKRVDCLRESNEWSDSDEISVGGSFIGPYGDVNHVGELVISGDFDAGEIVYPNATFATWPLKTTNDWPKMYTAIIVPVEKDDGGFAAFLQNMWKLIADKVKSAVAAAAAGAAAGAGIGGAIGGAIGAAVGAVVGLVIGVLIAIFEDDIMPPITLRVNLHSCTQSYYNKKHLTDSNGYPSQVTFGEGGSKYNMYLFWKVFT